MKKLFVMLLCVLLIMLLPMPAKAIGEDLGDYISPETGVWWTFVVTSLAIALDTFLGILLGIKNKELDYRILPQFLFTGVLPFIGGLALLGLLAYYIELPFAGMFYAAAAAIAAKYVADVWDKLKLLFGVQIK